MDCSGAVSFADLEAKEAQRFSRMLLELESRLYTPVATLDGQQAIVIEQNNTRHYYSEGYDANYECVSDSEIRQWQKTSLPNMSYLRIEGCGMRLPILDRREDNVSAAIPRDSDMDVNRDNFVEDLDSIGKLNDDLFVCGKSIAAPAGFKLNGTIETVDDSEYFAVHGILQEYIEYSGEPHPNNKEQTTVDNEQGLVDPQESQKEEVLSSMMDAIWPDIVHALKPLISDVLNAARDNNIPYKVDQTPPVQVDEYGGGGFDFASDDGW